MMSLNDFKRLKFISSLIKMPREREIVFEKLSSEKNYFENYNNLNFKLSFSNYLIFSFLIIIDVSNFKSL